MGELNERFVVPLAAMCREHGARHVYFCAGTEWAALPLDSCAALRIERAAQARAACAQAERMLDTLVGDRPFADPWHWAAFYVSGDGAAQASSPMPVTPSPSAP
jgi:hypothetical protein